MPFHTKSQNKEGTVKYILLLWLAKVGTGNVELHFESTFFFLPNEGYALIYATFTENEAFIKHNRPSLAYFISKLFCAWIPEARLEAIADQRIVSL